MPHFREGTDDEFIWDLVYTRNEYQLSDLSGHTVLDVGAHIGAFATRALEAGAVRVISVEPNQSSCEVYRRNLREELASGRATLLPYACWSDSGLMELHPCMLKDRHSGDTLVLHHGPGPIVQTVALPDLLRVFKPTALKLDCEGAEYYALAGLVGIPTELVGMWVEFHGMDQWMHRVDALTKSIRCNGFGCEHIGTYDANTKLFRFVRAQLAGSS